MGDPEFGVSRGKLLRQHTVLTGGEISDATRRFGYVRNWVEQKIRRHLMRARNRKGFGWNRWSRSWLYQRLGLFADYQIRYLQDTKALPAQCVT